MTETLSRLLFLYSLCILLFPRFLCWHWFLLCVHCWQPQPMPRIQFHTPRLSSSVCFCLVGGGGGKHLTPIKQSLCQVIVYHVLTLVPESWYKTVVHQWWHLLQKAQCHLLDGTNGSLHCLVLLATVGDCAPSLGLEANLLMRRPRSKQSYVSWERISMWVLESGLNSQCCSGVRCSCRHIC